MEVATDKTPAEGEVFVFTTGGGFVVKGSTHEVVQKLEVEDWPAFELAETGDIVTIRSTHVVALRGGSARTRRSSIGFVHRD